MEGHDQGAAAGGAALHADRGAPVYRLRVAGDRGGGNAARRHGHRLLAVGRVEQPEGGAHRYRHLRDRHRGLAAGNPAGRAGAPIHLYRGIGHEEIRTHRTRRSDVHHPQGRLRGAARHRPDR
ncbi:hypothetical protein G6F68_019294 [Rhizopus microsporus]|nr:hypothetical protein G6F68_019294 [Rhizopus microsporus]